MSILSHIPDELIDYSISDEVDTLLQNFYNPSDNSDNSVIPLSYISQDEHNITLLLTDIQPHHIHHLSTWLYDTDFNVIHIDVSHPYIQNILNVIIAEIPFIHSVHHILFLKPSYNLPSLVSFQTIHTLFRTTIASRSRRHHLPINISLAPYVLLNHTMVDFATQYNL